MAKPAKSYYPTEYQAAQVAELLALALFLQLLAKTSPVIQPVL